MKQGSLSGFVKPRAAAAKLGKRQSSPIDLDADDETRPAKTRRLSAGQAEQTNAAAGSSSIDDFVLPLNAGSMTLHAPDFQLGFSSDGGKAIIKEKLDLLYFKRFITSPSAKQLFEWLLRELPWYRVKYTVRGININTPRFTTVFGIDAKPKPLNQYKQRPRPIPPLLVRFKEQVEARIGADFNICLVNYYADGKDSISFHQDSEQFLGPNPTIASLSLGSTREFQMRPVVEKGEKSPIEKWQLESGDMIIMRGPTQANWLHAIPKRANAGGRINITLRKAMHPGGTENYLRYNIGDGPMHRWDGAKMVEQ